MKKTSLFLQSLKRFKIPGDGKSMVPVLWPKDILYIKKLSFNKIKVDDIVLTHNEKFLFAHRVIYKNSDFVVTKGDNNTISDGKIAAEKIIGKVEKIKRGEKILHPEFIYLLQSSIYFEQLSLLVAIFKKEKINYVFLKGLPLYLSQYQSFPHRVYADCDLLINQTDFTKVKQILELNNFIVAPVKIANISPAENKNVFEYSFHKNINGLPVVLDLHLQTVFMINKLGSLNSLYSTSNVCSITKDFLSSRQKIIINNLSFYFLSKENQIIYLALHFFNHGFRGIFRLSLIHELVTKFNFTPNNWLYISKKIKHWETENFVFSVFILLRKKYNTKIPDSFLRSIQPNSNYLRFIDKNILNINIFDELSLIDGGVERFKNLFFLSPVPFLKRLFVFANRYVLATILWSLWVKLYAFFARRQ